MALLWKRLQLVDADEPTLRGRMVSFFSQSFGLGIAGIEDETIPVDELVFELANLTPGFVSPMRKIAGRGASQSPAVNDPETPQLPVILMLGCRRVMARARIRLSRRCTRTRPTKGVG